jgi:hypothetical protein
MSVNRKKALLFNGFIVTALSLTTGIDSSKAQTQNSSEPSSTTVALHVDFNRPFIDLLFKRPDGSPRTARFWVDTGRETNHHRGTGGANFLTWVS